MTVNPLNIDPILFTLGPIQIRWYGIMYVLGFLIAGKVMSKYSKAGYFKVKVDEIEKYLTYLIVGMFLGARVFYVFIYNWESYAHDWLKIFSLWEGGLSFHGAAVGMSAATYIYARKTGVKFFEICDTMVLCSSIGIFFGRIGNFINGELYGRVTDSAVGLVFPLGGPRPRHPSQLYEGMTEGLILALILYFIQKRQKFYGVLTGTFLSGYAFFRYFVEFFREADSQLGYYFNETTTMGQILCILMFFVGLFALFMAKKMNLKVTRK